jgi:hypothetical protein
MREPTPTARTAAPASCPRRDGHPRPGTMRTRPCSRSRAGPPPSTRTAVAAGHPRRAARPPRRLQPGRLRAAAPAPRRRKPPAYCLTRGLTPRVLPSKGPARGRAGCAAEADGAGRRPVASREDRILYCKDSKRRGFHEHTEFTFLGFTFRREGCGPGSERGGAGGGGRRGARSWRPRRGTRRAGRRPRFGPRRSAAPGRGWRPGDSNRISEVWDCRVCVLSLR